MEGTQCLFMTRHCFSTIVYFMKMLGHLFDSWIVLISENTVLEKLSGNMNFWFDCVIIIVMIICFSFVFVIDIESTAIET